MMSDFSAGGSGWNFWDGVIGCGAAADGGLFQKFSNQYFHPVLSAR
jgi:hypothetical protein